MAGLEPGGLQALVDVERGVVSREVFVNEEIYRREQEQIFARAWLFVGHASQIPRPGDFLTSSMGEESVILCRDRGGRIRVFLNSCRHRGMKVCRYDEGNTVEFQCPYHGVSHRSVDMVGIGPSGQGRRDMGERNQARWLDVSFPELGHSMIAFLRPHDAPLAPSYQDAPVVADYFRRCEEERHRRRGP